MRNRSQNAQLARETLNIIQQGHYLVNDKQHEIPKPPTTSVISPHQWHSIIDQAEKVAPNSKPAEIEVSPESTTKAIQRLGPKTLVLNFASATHPGGSFLDGAQAQEECLARASTLYYSLQKATEYYSANQSCQTCLYTDYAILSTNVTFFRDDDGQLIPGFMADVISMPAPNAAACDPQDIQFIPEVFQRRMCNIFALAVTLQYPNLLLGAWGCGVFGNNPSLVAKLFLQEAHYWDHHLNRITFAVLDKTQPFNTELYSI